MKTVFKVKGMSCGGCRLGVENAIKKVQGVSAVRVSLEKAEAEVEFDERTAALKDIKAAVEKAGFTAG